VLTPEVLEKAQASLDQGQSRRDIAQELHVPPDTLRKAINDGRLREPKRSESASDKSSRTVQDAAAAEGLGTRPRRAWARPALVSENGCWPPWVGATERRRALKPAGTFPMGGYCAPCLR
jgi:hypothetical protein